MEPEQEEDIFSFAPEEETALSEPATEDVFILGADTEEELPDSSFEVPPIEAGPVSPEFELQFAPEEEYVPVLTTSTAPTEPSLSAAVETAPIVAGGEQALSEEQIASIIAKVSRDIIEKIAWEVVPDLAEMMIREEIRKIKKGIQD